MKQLDEQLIHTTILIKATYKDKKTGIGTGFFYQINIGGINHKFIATNNHVVDNAECLYLIFSVIKDGKVLSGKHIHFKIDELDTMIYKHPDKTVDLCLICIDNVPNQIDGQHLCRVFLTEENIITDEQIDKISHIEEIFSIGYPNGIFDLKNNLPIVKKGITATSIKYDFNGNKEFLIDCAIYPGSSGSPIYIFNQGTFFEGGSIIVGHARAYLVGIVYKTYLYNANGLFVTEPIQTKVTGTTITRVPNNLGIVIKASRLKEFNEYLKQKINLK